jgi:hypothetical protein
MHMQLYLLLLGKACTKHAARKTELSSDADVKGR